ncbi:MAG: AAA-like domain-containing protein [Caldilineaceae bacterium]
MTMQLSHRPVPNPFYHRTPIQDPVHFFGRGHALQHIGNLLNNGQSVSLIGPRRIGKSSLLVQLAQTMGDERQNGADRWHTVYFNGEAWQDQPPNVLYAALWLAILDRLRTKAAELPVANLPDANTTAMDFPTFQRALRQCRQANQRIILLLDEFDALSRNRHLDEVFFSSLRSLAATQGVVFVTASTAPLLELTYAQQSALSSPFFNIFLPQRLGLLSEPEAAELVTGTAALGGLAMNEDQCNDLLDLAGPHPFFLQIAGYHWWEAQQQDDAVDEHVLHRAIAAEAFPHWRYQWRYLPVAQQRALALLPTGEPQPPATLQPLHDGCLLRTMAAGGSYLSPLLLDFVGQQSIHQIIQAGPLLIDQQRQQAWLHGQLLGLSPQDYRLLELLAGQLDHQLSYTALAQQLWAEEKATINHQDRLKSAVSSLRRKLGDQGILLSADSGGYHLTLPL